MGTQGCAEGLSDSAFEWWPFEWCPLLAPPPLAFPLVRPWSELNTPFAPRNSLSFDCVCAKNTWPRLVGADRSVDPASPPKRSPSGASIPSATAVPSSLSRLDGNAMLSPSIGTAGWTTVIVPVR